MNKPILFSPIRISDLIIRNRIVLSPMCQYSARDGRAGDWHLVHYGKFALGGMGLIITEATAVEERGRITHGDLGIWSDDHIPGLRRITDFIRSEGAASAIQLSHAGRKGSSQRPWHGNGALSDEDQKFRGERQWTTVSCTDEAYFRDARPPAALQQDEIALIVSRFGEAAARADRAGFDAVEVHGAHGYLIASFLSPAVNTRTDAYGGDRAGRMRFALEVAREVRSRWPNGKPLLFRISTEDGAIGGWTIDDSVALGHELRQIGVDLIDCSSGGVRAPATLNNCSRRPGFQVHYAARIRRECSIMSMAVGLILDGPQAEKVLQAGAADLIAIGREAMFNPFWAHHAEQALHNQGFSGWNAQAGWWLERRLLS